MLKLRLCCLALTLGALALSASGALGQTNPYQEDARALPGIIAETYAYPERLAGGEYRLPSRLQAEAEAVRDEDGLIRLAERALMVLADHHAITGASFSNSWAVFPSYGDLWIERRGAGYRIEQVRAGSPAEQAGVQAGDELIAIAGTPVQAAVDAFWTDLGVAPGEGDAGYAARVLAAGRRDRPRQLTVKAGGRSPRTVELPNLYALKHRDMPPLSVAEDARGAAIIRFHDSLGRDDTIPAFDAAMAALTPGKPIILDLTDTASGGNTTVARAIMGWFVTQPTAYQIHNLPVEQRETGIARQWIEQVLPRAGKHHAGALSVRVSRWTGSMGEGLAIGLHAIGARVQGSRMAGLLGAIYDHALPKSGVIIKLPTERLYAVDGTPREAFQPEPIPMDTAR
ncbi:S41 family peptidase [Sphingobium sp. B8D3B]|nr:PDZ domain-containing protein [Sphingobium sp. B8D3B]